MSEEAFKVYARNPASSSIDGEDRETGFIIARAFHVVKANVDGLRFNVG